MVDSSHIRTLVRKLEQRDVVSDVEKEALLRCSGELRRVKAGDDIVSDGDRPNHSTLVVSGFSTRYRLLENGQRQITAIHVPGDFVDLHSFLLKEMDHAVGALSDCELLSFPHANLQWITEELPHLGRLLWLLTLIDGAIHREVIVSMGRRSALQQMAHQLCELNVRLEVAGLVRDNTFEFPITQAGLGDVLGLSSVHVNRTLQELRASGAVSWQGREVRILNWPRLKQLAEFDDRYLHLQREPR